MSGAASGAASGPASGAASVDNADLGARLRSFEGQAAGPPGTARDPVNEAMIRHWCDAMGDANPVYTDPEAAARSVHGGIVAPPTMLQAWNMVGLRPRPRDEGAMRELWALLDAGGYTSVVATNCEQQYQRYLRPGDLLVEETEIESVSDRKQTALGEGYFITTRRTYRDQDGELVGTMRFRLLRFRPAAADRAEDAGADGAGAAHAADAPPEPVPWPRPAVNDDNAFFWEGTQLRELRIQRCAACGQLRHPPTPACPHCGSMARDWVVSQGTGTVFSFVVHHHPPIPPLPLPFVVAVVELAEGVRVVGNVVDVDPGAVAVGMAVEVTFVEVDQELVLPQWRLLRP